MVHKLASTRGRIGRYVPDGVATDYRTPEFFQSRDRLRCRVEDAKEVQRPLLEDITSAFFFR